MTTDTGQPDQVGTAALARSAGEHLSLLAIRLDGGTQPRAAINDELVEEYSAEMNRGAEFPPVVVFFDGTNHWLADGFHRVLGRKKTGYGDIPADIHQGTKRDAILYSLSANATHGHRRTNEDKRRAVERMLTDREWRKWSDQGIARQCAVSAQMVGNYRRKLLEASLNGEEMLTRKVRRGGLTYTMKVSEIGKSRSFSSRSRPPVDQTRQVLMSLRTWLLDGQRILDNLVEITGGAAAEEAAVAALCAEHNINLALHEDLNLTASLAVFLFKLDQQLVRRRNAAKAEGGEP